MRKRRIKTNPNRALLAVCYVAIYKHRDGKIRFYELEAPEEICKHIRAVNAHVDDFNAAVQKAVCEGIEVEIADPKLRREVLEYLEERLSDEEQED